MDNLTNNDWRELIIMKFIKLILGFTLCIIMLKSLSFYTYASQTTLNEVNQVVDTENINSEESTVVRTERYNFDIASLLSLLGVGLLKFIDDKLKLNFRDNYKIYRICIVCATVCFSILEIAIGACFWLKLGNPSFGNLKNIFLGLIPVTFCFLTLLTMKRDWSNRDEQTTLKLNQKELDKRINDFTSSGMSPLGMLVGDMDFLGKVYNNKNLQGKQKKDNITKSTQVKALLDNNIDDIQIVCKQPVSVEDKKRIGYLLDTFENKLHIKFFDEKVFPIPKMRGRIMYKQSGQVVVITKKIKKKQSYEYSEHKVDSLPGGLFADLWGIIWACSSEHTDILIQCKEEYKRFIEKGENKDDSQK